MRLAPLAAALAFLLLAPSATASGASAPFTLGPGESRSFRLQLDQAGDVVFSIRFEPAGSVRNLVLDGPGKCDLTIDGSTGVGSSTMGNVRCRALPAGSHVFLLRMDLGYAQGSLRASAGRWA